MANFSEVGLGFAEFVALLLQETFDATLSAQNYQIEKFVELEKSLGLSNERFKELHLNDDMLLEKELDIFGSKLDRKVGLTADVIGIIEGIFEDTSGIIRQEKLTVKGLAALKTYVLESLVAEYKSQLNEVLNKVEAARLFVESGEIRAKLELTNLSREASDQGDTQTQNAAVKKKVNQASRSGDVVQNGGTTQPSVSYLSSTSVSIKGVKYEEIVDPETNKKTIIIDKGSVSGKSRVSFSMPSVRVTVRPASASSSSTLFSEVIIKFTAA